MCFGGGGSSKSDSKPKWTNRDKADLKVFQGRGGVGRGKDFRNFQTTRNDRYVTGTVTPSAAPAGSSLLTMPTPVGG